MRCDGPEILNLKHSMIGVGGEVIGTVIGAIAGIIGAAVDMAPVPESGYFGGSSYGSWLIFWVTMGVQCVHQFIKPAVLGLSNIWG